MTARLRSTDGIRVILLQPEQKKKGVDWSKLDLERRLKFGEERQRKEREYAATREALARQRLWGWLYYSARDLYRWLTGYVQPELEQQPAATEAAAE